MAERSRQEKGAVGDEDSHLYVGEGANYVGFGRYCR